MQPILAAFAVGLALELDLSRIAQELKNMSYPDGRMRLVPGRRDSVIIDDSYNASPIAVTAALRTLGTLQHGEARRIAILGDMAELGSFGAAEHEKLGPLATEVLDVLVTVGPLGKLLAKAAKGAGMNESHILCFESSIEAAQALPALVKEGDIVLVKGSQAARMERVTKALMREPERAHELLTRQGREWGS
jgi:UDP-N-acetylmuramyl pentapeptide synthase